MRTVPQSCRARLRARDFEFILSVLGASPTAAGSLRILFKDNETLEMILDDSRLLHAVLEMRYPMAISPELYFYILVRHGLVEAGITESSIADYVAATLAQYARGEVYSESEKKSELKFTYHVDFLEAIDKANDYDRFYLNVACGNHFLFLTGFFPRFLNHREDRKGAPNVNYYEGVARDAFSAASHHRLAGEFALTEVYQTISDRIGEMRRVLNRLASEYLYLGA